MTKLSVNVNKIATLRNARGGNVPDLLKVTLDCIRFGADGITVHPRPDERHIRKSDVYAISKSIKVEFNIEGYPSEDFLKLIEEVKPAQCTLVPDPPDVITSNAGWDTIKNQQFLKEVISRIHKAGVRTSIFLEASIQMVIAAKKTGTDRIELYTESYARDYSLDREKAIALYVAAARKATELGIGLNAGHDLNLENLTYLKKQITDLAEVSIGHALVSDALYLGLEETIRRYRECLK